MEKQKVKLQKLWVIFENLTSSNKVEVLFHTMETSFSC